MSRIDVFVAGAGPAGLAAAIALRQHGLRVTVADSRGPGIDKACGEGLMPDSLEAAGRIGISIPKELGFPFQGIRFRSKADSVSAHFSRGFGLGVRRPKLHQLLVNAADRAGVAFRWNSPVRSLDNVDARWIVGADGTSSLVRRWAGLEARLRYSRRYAYRQHFQIKPWSDLMEIYWSRGCQAYVTPVGPCEVCVACIGQTPKVRMKAMLARHFPSLHRRLEGTAEASREMGALTVSTRLRAVSRGNVALIGDASGSVDAITGEGLCLAFKQAGVLAEAIARGDLSLYGRIHPRLALRPHLMARAMLMLDQGTALGRAALGAMAWQPWIFRTLLAVHIA